MEPMGLEGIDDGAVREDEDDGAANAEAADLDRGARCWSARTRGDEC
jgi:hypothetical protein